MIVSRCTRSSRPPRSSSAPHSRLWRAHELADHEVDVGLPGVLPCERARGRVAVRLALALGCEVQPFSGSRASTTSIPTCEGYQMRSTRAVLHGGACRSSLTASPARSRSRASTWRRTRRRTSTTTRSGGGVTHVDLNRAGAPLVEIVSTPAITRPRRPARTCEACARSSLSRRLRRRHGEGPFRCDAKSPSAAWVTLNWVRARSQEPELVPLRRARHRVRGPPPGGAARGRRQGPAADHALDVARGSRLRCAARSRRTIPYFPVPTCHRCASRQTGSSASARSCRAAACPTRTLRRGVRSAAYDAAVLTEDRDVSEFFEAVLRSTAKRRPSRTGSARSARDDDGDCEAAARAAATPEHLAELLALVDAAASPRAPRARSYGMASRASGPSRSCARAGSKRCPTPASSSAWRAGWSKPMPQSRSTAPARQAAELLRRPGDEGVGGKADPERLRECSRG